MVAVGDYVGGVLEVLLVVAHGKQQAYFLGQGGDGHERVGYGAEAQRNDRAERLDMVDGLGDRSRQADGFEHHVAANHSQIARAIHDAFTTYLGWECYWHQG